MNCLVLIGNLIKWSILSVIVLGGLALLLTLVDKLICIVIPSRREEREEYVYANRLPEEEDVIHTILSDCNSNSKERMV